MQQLKNLFLVSLTSIFFTGTTFADSLKLSSKDIAHGEFMSKTHEFQGFGCDGSNLSHNYLGRERPKAPKASQFSLMIQTHQLAVAGGIGKSLIPLKT